ncbi:short-chain dehydrogenase [[Bacillus] caldolyticus]|uniref:Short-chain dehydrogenase n=1 Tax=Bacillus caldolyticus TaxID=1394 RepID=A0ABN5FT62_BACCL|nr:short-chain dehydrogenase [[Bacillus] caldolyticus]AUI36043.1 short-chain dehydrogenase [[Bacillus] caldolyticus]
MHALVIGGTGMLTDVSLWLVREGYHVSIVARNRERMERLIARAAHLEAITPLLVDYRDHDVLCSLIHQTINENRAFDLVVAWVHTDGKQAFPAIIRENSRHPGPWRLFHVLGSRAHPAEAKRELRLSSACLYRQIQLGFVIEEHSTRWLTHQEISSGVIDAIRRDAPFHLVGTLASEKKRPH